MQERLETAAADHSFLAHMNRVLCRLDHYPKAGDTWYGAISGTAPGMTGCQFLTA